MHREWNEPMELKDLRKHIRTLAALPETGAPVISCYLALERGAPKDRNAIDERVRSLRNAWIGQARHDFGEAMDRIEAHLPTELMANAQRAAVFSRAGEQPYFLPLQFRVPLSRRRRNRGARWKSLSTRSEAVALPSQGLGPAFGR